MRRSHDINKFTLGLEANMVTEYKSLDKIRSITSQRRGAIDLTRASHKSFGGFDVADASGCLSYINLQYRDGKDGDKALMRKAVSCYVSDDKRQALYDDVLRIAEQCYQSKSMRARHAGNMARVAVINTLDRSLSDAECAHIMGVAKSTYSQSHAHVFEQVAGEIAGVLSVADDLAARYWRLCKINSESA